MANLLRTSVSQLSTLFANRTPKIVIAPNTAPQKPPTVLFVGSTGAGKSALCNFLHDLGESPHLCAEADITSHEVTTKDTSFVPMKIGNSLWHNGWCFNFIDTPGLNASPATDLQHMVKLCQAVQIIGEINAIVLVIPYNFKLDLQWVDTMSFFRDAFYSLFARGHACLAINHMSADDFQRADETVGGFSAMTKQVLAECNEKLR